MKTSDCSLMNAKGGYKLSELSSLYHLLAYTAFINDLAEIKFIEVKYRKLLSIDGLLRKIKKISGGEYTAFIEFSERYTPFKYSINRKCMIRQNGGHWGINETVLFFYEKCPFDVNLLKREIINFIGYYPDKNKSFNYIGFIEYLQMRIKKENHFKILARRYINIKHPYYFQKISEKNRISHIDLVENSNETKIKSRNESGVQLIVKEISRYQKVCQEKAKRRQEKARKRQEHEQKCPRCQEKAKRRQEHEKRCQEKAQRRQEHEKRCQEKEQRIKEQRIKEQRNQENIEAQLIKGYLERNPGPASTGPMGTPKGKYRHNTYGIRSMEFDNWGRS